MKKDSKERLILVTNDDGVHAKGLLSLIEVLKEFGRVVVVGPKETSSGMGHAITVKVPLRIKKLEEAENFEFFLCTGTPVDCVKMANSVILDRKPDLLVSGINHGPNSAASVFYSGTMGAALEGALMGVPSVGFSLADYHADADFTLAKKYVRIIVSKLVQHELPFNYCLNVNIPAIPEDYINGIKICRQTKGYWEEDFEKRTDPGNKDYYWLTGKFVNLEPEAEDTDEWALNNNYVSIVPISIDMTANKGIEELKNWHLEDDEQEA